MDTTNTATAPTGAAPQNLFLAAFAFVVGLIADYTATHPNDPPYFTATAPEGLRYRLLQLERDGRAIVETPGGEAIHDWKMQPGELTQCAIYVAGALGLKVELPVWYTTPGEQTQAAAAGANVTHDAATAGMSAGYKDRQP